MIKKFKHWLIERILPIWARSELLKENDRLQKENQELRIHIKQLDAYIDGLEFGIRNQRRLTINNHMAEQPSVFIPDQNHKPLEEVRK